MVISENIANKANVASSSLVEALMESALGLVDDASLKWLQLLYCQPEHWVANGTDKAEV